MLCCAVLFNAGTTGRRSDLVTTLEASAARTGLVWSGLVWSGLVWSGLACTEGGVSEWGSKRERHSCTHALTHALAHSRHHTEHRRSEAREKTARRGLSALSPRPRPAFCACALAPAPGLLARSLPLIPVRTVATAVFSPPHLVATADAQYDSGVGHRILARLYGIVRNAAHAKYFNVVE